MTMIVMHGREKRELTSGHPVNLEKLLRLPTVGTRDLVSIRRIKDHWSQFILLPDLKCDIYIYN